MEVEWGWEGGEKENMGREDTRVGVGGLREGTGDRGRDGG